GVDQVTLQNWVTQFKDYSAGREDLRAGPDHDAVDTRSGLCRDPANIKRHECAEPADLADHRSALHFVGPDRGPVDRRSGRLELGESVGDAGNEQQSNGGVDDAANLLRPGV